MRQRKVVYTDLDGTLLELDTYDHTIAEEKVHKLIEKDIPVIFCSSKTYAEQQVFQKKLGISQPVITENGSGVFIPTDYNNYFGSLDLPELNNHYVYKLGADHDFILSKIQDIRADLSLEVFGYSDLEPAEISAITNIPEEELQPTLSRDFSETLIKGDFSSSKFSEFTRRLQSVQLQCIPGSKFYTISSINSDKGKAVMWVQKQFEAIYGHMPLSSGVGDSQNDIAMLEQTDHAYLVQKPDGSWAAVTNASIIRIPLTGPYGWNKVADRMLRKN